MLGPEIHITKVLTQILFILLVNLSIQIFLFFKKFV